MSNATTTTSAAASPNQPPSLPPGAKSYSARLYELAAEREDDNAVVFVALDGSEQLWSWRQVADRSTQIARGLQRHGVVHGDRVGIKIRNSVEHIAVALACYHVGAVPVPVRWDLPDWELQRVLDVLAAKLVVELDHDALAGTTAESTEPLPDVVAPNASGILSSGSTGTPKVILRVPPGMYFPGASSNRLVEAYGELGPQLLLVPAPLYHNNGFMAIGNLFGGDRLLLLERFDPAVVLAAIERHRVTGVVATTVMLQRLARDESFDTRDLSSLDWVMHGAAPLPEWLARQWIERIGPEHFYVCYGSSEGAGATFARGDEYLAHPGTVGKGAMATDLKILDDEQNEVPNGEIGHVYMKSAYGLLASYVGNVAPIPSTPDGYVTVGDLGWLDDDGYLYLSDRRVDMIVSGGANVYPAEVEAALSEHPEVADVVVIGLSDPEWGRRVHAVVQRAEGSAIDAEALRSYSRERLAPYKVPKTVEFVESISRSEATKLNRAALVAERERTAEENS
jgi:bile acid-coenzyme A ligase